MAQASITLDDRDDLSTRLQPIAAHEIGDSGIHIGGCFVWIARDRSGEAEIALRFQSAAELADWLEAEAAKARALVEAVAA